MSAQDEAGDADEAVEQEAAIELKQVEDPASTENEDPEVIDVSPSGCSVENLPSSNPLQTKEMFVFDNVFTVLPSKLLKFRNLKLLKLFSNEVKYFPSELEDLPGLQHLQVRASPMGLSSFLPLGKMSGLKALELHQLPLRSSASSIPADIAQLQELTRLSICNFSISFLPPEIASLHKLQELDLSFNKLKFLPKELSKLALLKTLKLANNKLVELPAEISAMTALTNLDVGYNRLTSLLTIDLCSMTGLQQLNAQFNRLQTTGEVPEWLVCNFEGNEWLRIHSEKKKLFLNIAGSGLQSKAVAIHDRFKRNRKHKLEPEPELDLEEPPQGENTDEMVENDIALYTTTTREEETEVRPENTALQIQQKKVVTYKKREGVLAEANPKPSKRSKASEDASEISFKYSAESFCGFGDYLPDGFYDAGRNHPFVAFDVLEKEQFSFDSREVILVDSSKDEELDGLASSARRLFTSFNHVDSRKVAMLALFVSDCFGGSDKSLNIKTMRRAALGSTSSVPFVCSCCSTAAADNASSFSSSLPSMRDLSDKAVRHVKLKRASNVVPLGSLHHGVCRHRAILLKYLCDRTHPPIPCELIRGYLDYMPHAWNVVLASKDGAKVRMLVDACRPLDVRPETDPEYFCRYIPMRRLHLHPRQVELGNQALPVFYESIGCGASGADVKRCSLGGFLAAAKVRHLEGGVVGAQDIGWLSELRIHCSIGEHPNVVSFYGHQLSLDPPRALSTATKKPEAPQLVIFMEYIKGGSLENLLLRFSKKGCLYTPPDLALCIAESVARGLVWLHSRGIIHRDVKSSNILVDLDSENGASVVKICDFDSAVPLGSSSVHTCYLAHYGLPLTDVCVGTPRWIAPEVLDAIYSRQQYGLEADIWSFGCLIAELLTLQVPYAGIDDSEIHNYIKAGQRPSLTWKLEDIVVDQPGSEILQKLVDLYESCTQLDPAKRPKAQEALSRLSSSRKPEECAS